MKLTPRIDAEMGTSRMEARKLMANPVTVASSVANYALVLTVLIAGAIVFMFAPLTRALQSRKLCWTNPMHVQHASHTTLRIQVSSGSSGQRELGFTFHHGDTQRVLR